MSEHHGNNMAYLINYWNTIRNILLSVHQSCFAAPRLEAWERLFPGHHGLGPGHWETLASSVEDESLSSPSADPQKHREVSTEITLFKCKSACVYTEWGYWYFVQTISRFSFIRLFSFSSSFWIVWVKSSFLLLSSLFLSSRGLHCFSDSRTRFS